MSIGMENDPKAILGEAVAKSRLCDEERLFLSGFIMKAAPEQLDGICRTIETVTDVTDYLLSLVYGVRIRRYLETLSYLTTKERVDLMKLVASLSGTDARKLHKVIANGIVVEGDSDVFLSDLKEDLNRILSATQARFTEHIERCSDRNDRQSIRKILDTLHGTADS